MPPALKVLIALAEQIKGVSIALEAVTSLIENARRNGREVSLDELKGLSLGAHTAVDSLAKALEKAE